MNIYFSRIKPLFDNSGKSDTDLEKEIGIPARKISQWNCKYTKSYTKYIPQIAAYFGVTTDYLLGNSDDPRQTGGEGEPGPASGAEPIPGFYELSKEDQQQVRNFVAFLHSKSGQAD